MSMAERFVLVGIGGVYNYGSQAIVRGTVRMLRHAFPGCRILYASFMANYDRPALADLDIEIVAARPRFGFHRIMRKGLRQLGLPWRFILDFDPSAFRGATAALSVGGDTYTDHSVGFQWGSLRAETQMLRMGTPVSQWSATIGPFSAGSPQATAMKEFLDRNIAITARESCTLEYLRSIGVTQNVIHVSDAAFAAPFEEFDAEPLMPRRRCDAVVAFNITPQLDYYVDHSRGKDIIDIGTECARALLDQLPISLAFVPHVVGEYLVQNDHIVLRQIMERLGDTGGRVSIWPEALGMQKTKYALSRCDAVITGRMHCSIASLTTCTPVLVISYSEKSKGVFRDVFGNDQWILPLGQLSPETAVSRVRELLERRTEVRSYLQRVIPGLQERAWAGVPILKERLARR